MATTTRKKTNQRSDIYQRVTASIVEQLKAGVRPWTRPWNAEHAAGRITRPLRHNAEPYSGINVLMLWAAADENGFACPLWLTFRQAQQLGGFVRKGEKGSPVVYANTLTKAEENESGEVEERKIPYLKSYASWSTSPTSRYERIQIRIIATFGTAAGRCRRSFGTSDCHCSSGGSIASTSRRPWARHLFSLPFGTACLSVRCFLN